MKDRKIAWRFFTIAAWDKEQAYLRREHQKGWKLERIDGLTLYHFTRCTPEDVVYQLDYRPETAEKASYVRMFEDCGWTYIQDYAGYSYFRKPVSEMNGREEEIFCDDASRLAMLRRVFLKRMTPVLVVLLLLVIPCLRELRAVPSVGSVVLLVLYLLLCALSAAVCIQFLVRYLRLRGQK